MSTLKPNEDNWQTAKLRHLEAQRKREEAKARGENPDPIRDQIAYEARSAQNDGKDELRQQEKFNRFLLRSRPPSRLDDLKHFEIREDLGVVLSKLTQAQRDLLFDYFVHRIPVAEIAAAAKVKQSTIYARLKNAVKIMRDLYEDD